MGQWLEHWLDTAIKPPAKRLWTYETYRSVITRHLHPALGHLPLQRLQPSDIQRYYTESSLSPTSLEQHHALLHSALKAALMQNMVTRNVATLVMRKPKRTEGQGDARMHCWTAEGARRFLQATHQAGAQMAAFYHLALDTGARRGELCGLHWEHVSLESGTVAIVQQLVKPGAPPMLGPPKNGMPRTIQLTPQTIALLRAHKAQQAGVKLANGYHYHDYGLVFAKDWHTLHRHGDTLGHLLQVNSIGQREFKRLSAEAGLKLIKFHGLRYTCATLLLQAGVPVHVVQQRLGHKRADITLNTYAHVLPAMQHDAASKLSALLQGS